MAGSTKVAVTVAAAAGLALAAWILWPSGKSPPAAPPAEVADGVAEAPADDRPGRAAPPSDERARAPETAPVAPVVRGRITDAGGAPVGGAAVLVGGTSNPFGADAREPVRFDEFVGRRIVADADGRWEATLAAAGTVVVALDRDPAYDAQGEPRREVRAPAEGVDFTVARKPCATLVVRVTDLDAGAPLKDFRCSFGGGAQGFSLFSAKDGVLEARLRLTQERGAAVKVTLADPAAPEPVAQEVVVDDGARAEVQLALRRTDVLRGRVLDAEGKPAAGALVFLGSHLRGRGDEPFKPFRPDRIRDGVRTGADGAFELRGRGTVVTAWREDGSVATVPVAEAADLRLPAPGAIRGRLLDREGRPVGGAKLSLDRARETETDADGRFSYDGVEPGVRGVMIAAEKRFVGVRVRPGAASEVAIEPGLEEVRIPWEGAAPKDALLVGLDDVAAVSIPTVDGSDLVARDLPKGRYLLLARGGVVVPIDVDGPAARAERGTCTLTVRAKPGSSAFVVPAGSGPLVDRLAARASTLTVDPNGEARFQLLRPGRYAVGFDRGSDDDELRTLVEVTPAGAEVKLD